MAFQDLSSKPAVSAKKRQREILQYVAAFRGLPRIEGLSAAPQSCPLPASHQAQASSDAVLSALVHCAALRMKAQRALVSLIDETHQYILAEATPQSRPCAIPRGQRHQADALWLGASTIPRSWLLCEEVFVLESDLTQGTGAGVVVSQDLSTSDLHKHRSFVCDGLRLRFHVGVPLICPNGVIIGSLSIFDDQPRTGVAAEDVNYLNDLSNTIVEHLSNHIDRDRFQSIEKCNLGLLDFAAGAARLLPDNDKIDRKVDSFSVASYNNATSETSHRKESLRIDTGPQFASGKDGQEQNHTAEQIDVDAQESSHNMDMALQSSVGAKITPGDTTPNKSLSGLQESILPLNSKLMFARAAHAIQSSCELDGVIIFDASIAATGHQQHPSANVSDKLTESSSEGFYATDARLTSDSDNESEPCARPKSSSDRTALKKCQVLGVAYASGHAEADPNFGGLAEVDLARLLRDYPNGKIFHYGADGTSMSSTDESSSNSSSNQPHRRFKRVLRSSKAVSELLIGARSVAFVPFWDYERSRWFAGCLCWTNDCNRVLSVAGDLAFFRVFSHSIMRELSRLDAIASTQQKITFVASISHELRSPLHGILGTLEFFKDTPLDAFQISMLNSLNSCGRTLLDTINHVMDHSKLSDPTRSLSTRRLKNNNTLRLSSKPLKTRNMQGAAFDLGVATEEVVEAVFAGASFLPIMDTKNSLSPTSGHTESSIGTSKPRSDRKLCYIILNIAESQDWTRSFPIGSWKRMVMNLFGNALKYTDSGYITVSLQTTDASKSKGNTSTVTLTVMDTGIGMSQGFLADKAFMPYAQENTHSSGVGLGLSITRQIIETNGGKVEISSDPALGTKVTVRLSLNHPDPVRETSSSTMEYETWLQRLHGRKVCVLHKASVDTDSSVESRDDESLTLFTSALIKTLRTHLHMDVVQTSRWHDGDADLVICPDISFEYLASIRHRRAVTHASKAAVTVFIAMDAFEASTLRSDVRIQSKESVVEIMTQPLGPWKLAFVLNRCLNRYENPLENTQPTTDVDSTLSLHDLLIAIPQELQSQDLNTIAEALLRHQNPNSDTQSPHISSSTTSSSPLILTETDIEQSILVHSESEGARESPQISPRILITDDNVINRKILINFMNKHKLRYSEAKDGIEAVNAYRTSKERFDVILMDISMPVMDGITATREIRRYEKESKIPRSYIIALTGLASASARLEALNAGVNHYMTKPVNFKSLKDMLSNPNPEI